MRALIIERHLHRFAAAKTANALFGSGSAIGLGPLRLLEAEAPALPENGWYRLRPRLSGICGSDLSTVDGASSRYFEPIVSFPFVLGHEIVGELLSGPNAGARVVVEPVLGCLARGIEPPCPACARGEKGGCERIGFGHLKPGLQTGYCADTGGGWSEELIVHESQVHLVPPELSDEAAVMVEPTACGIHAALKGEIIPGECVVVIGAGTVGLTTLAGIRAFSLPGTLLVGAKYPAQREHARALGADLVIEPDELGRAVRRITGSLALGARAGEIERLTGGADVVYDCVGSSGSLAQALSLVRPAGRVILVGMPTPSRVDLTPLWQREISLTGAYAYGVEHLAEGDRSTFELALELVQSAHLEDLVSDRYPLESYEDAIRHAATAGRRGATKIVFDLRPTRGSWQESRRIRALGEGEEQS